MAGTGGKRPGAGRKPGAATKITREIANREAQAGLMTPLEVALDNMRHFQTEAKRAEELIASASIDLSECDPKEAYELILAEVKRELHYRALALKGADIAMSFMHPKLGTVDPGKPKADVPPIAVRVKRYLIEDQIKASKGKVVAIK